MLGRDGRVKYEARVWWGAKNFFFVFNYFPKPVAATMILCAEDAGGKKEEYMGNGDIEFESNRPLSNLGIVGHLPGSPDVRSIEFEADLSLIEHSTQPYASCMLYGRCSTGWFPCNR